MTNTTIPSDLRRRIPELDGIRGLAIGLVILHHYFFVQMSAPAGSFAEHALAIGRLTWSGVDLFFVLSGFLIGGILLDSKDASNYFQIFYKRRFFRIVPIYSLLLVAWLAIRAAIHWHFVSWLSWLPSDRVPAFCYLFFVQNFALAYFNVGFIPLAVTWSLAVEEQFYLTLPLVIRLVNRAYLLRLVLAGILLAPVFRLAVHFLWPERVSGWYALMPSRADALLLGVLGAIFMRDKSCREWIARHQTHFRVALAVLLLGAAALTKYEAGFWNSTGTLIVFFGYTWLALFYLWILLYALNWPNSVLSRCLRWEWLRWLGSIAYGVYLFHYTFLYLLYGFIWSRPPTILSLSNFLVTILALAFTLLFCWASWTFFERPLVKLGHREGYRFASGPRSVPVSPAVLAES